MDSFLVWSKNIQDDFASASEVHIVLGNEACDLDSAVSAITYAYYLRNKYKDSAVLPVLNIPEDQYRLRTETSYFFKKLNIPPESLTFRDQIDFESLQSDKKLRLYLVDHNILTGNDIIYEDSVVKVIDHHVQERKEKDGVKVKLDFVGSCSTLVAEELLEDPDFHIDEKLAELLFGTILVDTINRSPTAGKITPRDQDVLDKLQTIIPNVKGDDLYKELQTAKFDMSGLLNMEILEKDLKMVPGSGMTIAMASVTMDMEELLERPNFQKDLAEFSAKKGADVVVIMTLTTDENDTPSRQIAVYSQNRIYKEQIADVLDNAADENLELEPGFPPFETISVFKQGNMKASRKKVMPILKSFLQGDVTPDVTSKEFVPQQSVSMTNEGFTSFTSLLESGSNNVGQNSPEEKPTETKNVLFNLDSFEGLENSLSDSLTDSTQNGIKSNFATVNTQITNPGVNFDMFATQNDDSEFGSVTPSDAGKVSKSDNPFSQFSSTNLSSVNSSNMLDFLTSDSELVDPFSSVEENVTQTTNPDKIGSISSDLGFNKTQSLLDISVPENSVKDTSSSNTKLFDTNPFFDVSTDNAQSTTAQNMDILVDFTNTSEVVSVDSNTNNGQISDNVMNSLNPFSVNSETDGSHIVQSNPFILPDNLGQQNLDKGTNLMNTDVSVASNSDDVNNALNQFTRNSFVPLDSSDTFGLTSDGESQIDIGANSTDPFGIFDKPSSDESKNGNDTLDLFESRFPYVANPFEIESDSTIELNKNNPFNLPLDTNYAAESQFEDIPENETPFQMDYLDIENDGKTTRPKARKSISLIVEIDQHSEEKLDELNEADFFDKVPTPDIQHSGENSPFINSGVCSPLEGIPTPNTVRVSGFPSLSTPPNSVMEESGFDALDHGLPSFNSAEMVERINRKKASLGNIEDNLEKTEEEGKASVTFTPQNSFHDDAPIPSVNLILPDIDSPEMENTIQVKRNSLITAQEFTSAEEDLLGLTKSEDEKVIVCNKNGSQRVLSTELEAHNDIAFATDQDMIVDNVSDDFTDTKVPYTPVNSYVDSSGASYMQNRDTFADSELFDRLNDIKRGRSDTGQNSVTEGFDISELASEGNRLSDLDDTTVLANVNNENNVNGTLDKLDNMPAIQDELSEVNKAFVNGFDSENIGNNIKSNQDILVSLSETSDGFKSFKDEKKYADNNFFDSLLDVKERSIEPINSKQEIDAEEINLDLINKDSISNIDERLGTGKTSNNEILQIVQTEVVQNLSESITSELINHAVDVFPDMTNPDVAECVTMEILTDSSDWTDQGSGDSGIGSSDSPQQAILRAPTKSPRSPRRAPASQYSLETDYMPNMDPFQGNLNIVTSPSTVVQSVETDAGKEVVEEESFRRVSVEGGHDIPIEPFSADELQDVEEVSESSIRDMIISENLEMSQKYDDSSEGTLLQSDLFSKSDFVEGREEKILTTIKGQVKLDEVSNDLITANDEAIKSDAKNEFIIGSNKDIDGINAQDKNFMKESESRSEEMENIGSTEPTGKDKLEFESSKMIDYGAISNEPVFDYTNLTEPGERTSKPNLSPKDQSDSNLFDDKSKETTKTQSIDQPTPPSELLLESIADSDVQMPIEINIEACSISPDSSNSFNSSTDSEVDLVTVRENIVDSSPTDPVEQMEETVSEVNAGQEAQETIIDTATGLVYEEFQSKMVVSNESKEVIENDLTVDKNEIIEINQSSDELAESTLTIETISPAETPDHEHASGFYEVNPEVKSDHLERSFVDTNLGDNETGFYEFNTNTNSMTESALTVESVSQAETPMEEHITGFYEINPINKAVDKTPEISVSMTTSTETENSDDEDNTGFYEMNSEIKGTVLQNIEIGDAFSPAESPNDDIIGISYQINPMIPDLRTQSSIDTDENDKSDMSVFESASTTETKTSLDEDTNTNDETLFHMADGLVNEAIKGAFETVHEIHTLDDTDVVKEIEDAMIEEDIQKDGEKEVEEEDDDKSSESSEDSDISSTTTEGSYRINCSPVMTPESESMLEEHVKKLRTNEVYVIEESANEELEEEDEPVEEIIINKKTDNSLCSEMELDSGENSVKQEHPEEGLVDLTYRNNEIGIDNLNSKTMNEVQYDVSETGSNKNEDQSGSSALTLLRQETIIPDIVISTEDFNDPENKIDGGKNSNNESEPNNHQELVDEVTSKKDINKKQSMENEPVHESRSAEKTVDSDTQNNDKVADTKYQMESSADDNKINVVAKTSNNVTGAISKSKKEESSVSITKSKLSEQEYTTRKEIFYTTAGRMSVSIDSVVDPPGLADHVSHGGSQNPISEETMQLQIAYILAQAKETAGLADEILSDLTRNNLTSITDIHGYLVKKFDLDLGMRDLDLDNLSLCTLPGDEDFDPLDLKDASQITETNDSQQHQQQSDSAQQQQEKSNQDKGVIRKSNKKKNDGKMKEMEDTQEWHEDPIPGMGIQDDDVGSSESESESDSDSEYGKPVRPDSLLAGKRKKKIVANSNIVSNDSTDDLVEGVDDLPTPDDLETPDDMEGELEWEDDTPITPSSEKKFADYIHTRDDDDDDDKEFEQNTRMRKVEIAGKDYKVDMHVIEPYKKVLSHGGYYGDGLNAIILFCGCYLPDRSRRDYQYVMDNLFLYVISTLELLVAEDYMIVYFHGATPRRQMPSFGWLKRCYQMIDRRLRKNLKALLMVHPTLWLKTVVMMTKPFISSKFSSKLRFVKTLQELGKIVPMEYIYIPDPVQHTEVMLQKDPNYLEKLDKEYQKKGLLFKKKKR